MNFPLPSRRFILLSLDVLLALVLLLIIGWIAFLRIRLLGIENLENPISIQSETAYQFQVSLGLLWAVFSLFITLQLTFPTHANVNVANKVKQS
ncbi:hypothetical protein AQUCO_00700376v1 [Aquilegia coerulea]|uniref:Uncharacterized protein n=1 Tax=Aquilegia coerulea TaxID=218851 RepID=A0A2G5EJS3_AQUCA|nr:hypothetical protein AQUCO_00700376v1 [Aquilegia coerulea]